MRRKIWEDPNGQCPIIGTCLSLKELRKIARQTKLSLGSDAQEFDIHAGFVHLCSSATPVAKAVNKALDKKYAGTIKRFNKASTDSALLDLWDEAKSQGNIPGPYWALMTHPRASTTLRRKVFGDVHMLSHLVGASNRADIRRLAELENTLSATQERNAKIKTSYRERLRSLTRDNRSLSRRLGILAKEAETLRFKAKEHCNEVVYQENQNLQRALASQSALIAEEQARSNALKRRLQAHEAHEEHLETQLREKQAEVEFLEQELIRHSATADCPAGCDKAGTADCPGPALCGKRILYVGGRTNLVQHYREVVERQGGTFLHHDGGVEQTRQTLPRMMHSVDAVVCPVDCVSHDACQCVKEVCKHTMKPCKLMRSSGLSSLVRSLQELDMPTTVKS